MEQKVKTNKAGIINQVKVIILKHSKPVRIYLYGSQINGEASAGSDIDIAYEDPDNKNGHLIEDEIKQINTLIKIDVKNISKTEERFKNRVKSTGRVLYSSTKELRAQDGLHNFSNALDKFIDVVDRFEEFKNEGFGDVYLDLIVKRFEFTYEMSWKAVKRYLEFIGLEAKSPRGVFKEAYAQQIITDEDIWLDMIEQRNLSSHVYDESEMNEILEKKNIYKDAFVMLKNILQKGLNN